MIWYRIILYFSAARQLTEAHGRSLRENDQEILGPDPHQYLFGYQDYFDDH
jgi:hypothetical protein